MRFHAKAPSPGHPTGNYDQRRDYQRYKQYQKRNQHVLDMTENLSELNSYSIEQLLTNYAIVERIYDMRYDYRSKYFTLEQWDSGHEQFFTYLLEVMDIYRRLLTNKFNQLLQQAQGEQEQGKQEIIPTDETEKEAVPEILINNSRRKIEQINEKLRERMREEEEIWGSEIPKLIEEKQRDYQKAMGLFQLIQRFLNSYIENVSEAQVIDVINYFFLASDLNHLKTRTKSVRIDKVYPYPLTKEEFTRVNVVNSDAYRYILKDLYQIRENRELLTCLLRTLLNVTNVTRKYNIIELPLKNESVALIPTLNNKYQKQEVINRCGLMLEQTHLSIVRLNMSMVN